MKDITSREDLYVLISKFYHKLLIDPSINFIFIDVAKINVEEHLEIITDFWDQIIFLRGRYRNNVLQIHQQLHQNFPFNKTHFDTWLNHFNQTVDENFKGENAEICKTKALSIATIMQIKI